MKYAYEITDVENIKGAAIRDVRIAYKKLDIEVSVAKKVTVVFHDTKGLLVSSDKGISRYITVIKVDNSWYMDMTNASSLYHIFDYWI